ncbi:MAG: hypothetical protein KJ871_03350 [Alphaproteobacteria bacterium]|nr:hypothetical protein [Alphaproteobacteria bacterium]MBU2085744.1 hypothetical protein [Alphaproteobacteria bacterium]MBU2141571.1 hypothetical protein [Alphaproteobacteria bacterium]MBU2197535.1 hypothetical protein [Alphaproteobacteria bacterium]
MTEIQDATLEGRLLAQRQVLAELLAACDRAGGPLSEWVRSFVADDFGPRDYAEDPGALPDAAFAVESVIAQEKRLLASETQRILDADTRS